MGILVALSVERNKRLVISCCQGMSDEKCTFRWLSGCALPLGLFMSVFMLETLF